MQKDKQKKDRKEKSLNYWNKNIAYQSPDLINSFSPRSS